MSPTLVILLTGSAVAASCALVGSFLVLRRMALLGDAISHAVLPGIVLAFLFTGGRSALPMVLGAGALGLATVFLVELFNRSRRLKEDASIGVVFPALFSFGVLLISRRASQVDLDLDCVLYGEIAYAPWDLLLVGAASLGPKALWVNGATLAVNLLLVILLYKELKVTTFDPELAAALGFAPVLVHYLLMGAVSVTVVGAFESVGAILVVAMLVVPPATAHLLTERLGPMLVLAVALGVASALGGYAVARWLDASIAGAMAAVAGALFVAALVASPRHGLAARALTQHRLRERIAAQILLLHLSGEAPGQVVGRPGVGEGTGPAGTEAGLAEAPRPEAGSAAATRDASGRVPAPGAPPLPAETVRRRFGWSEPRLRRMVGRLARQGLVERRNGHLVLTAAGAAAVEGAGTAQLAHPLAAATPRA
ncbi:MAG TPA: metal ABC transporter permease [Thermoanaerobaculia bacterium]|nr:metal ABC transporter permease [Thermoanaerobaculia bacterium]